jgi:hypothetical protein
MRKIIKLRCSVLLTLYDSERSEDRQDDNEHWGLVMLSGGEVVIRAEIERLEKALRECTDGGIRNRIKAWIEEEKKELRAGNDSKNLRGKRGPKAYRKLSTVAKSPLRSLTQGSLNECNRLITTVASK